MENEEFEDLKVEEKNILNKGEITREDIIHFSRISMIKNTICFTLIGAILFILGFSLLIAHLASSKNDNLLLFYSLGLLVCGALIIGLPFVIVAILPSIMSRQNKSIINGFKYKYLFTNDTVDITLVSDVSKIHTSLNYLLIYKVKVFGDMVFIYLNSNVLYMLKLSGFENKEDMMFVAEKMNLKIKVKEND